MELIMTLGVFHDGFIFNAGLSPAQWRPIEQKDIDLLLLKPGFDAKVLTYICCLKKYGDGTYNMSFNTSLTFFVRWLQESQT
jgi:hypothetical protein